MTLMRIGASAYDAGEEAAAKSLATSLRVMVHDTRSSRSLLSHLGVKDHLPYLDTAPAEPPAGVISLGCGLCIFNLDTGTQQVTYRAPLDDLSTDLQHPHSCFEDWWRLPVLCDTGGRQFSRADLVLTVANKDGGAHVDDLLPEDYAALTRGNSLGFGQAVRGEPNTASLAFSFEDRTAPDG